MGGDFITCKAQLSKSKDVFNDHTWGGVTSV